MEKYPINRIIIYSYYIRSNSSRSSWGSKRSTYWICIPLFYYFSYLYYDLPFGNSYSN